MPTFSENQSEFFAQMTDLFLSYLEEVIKLSGDMNLEEVSELRNMYFDIFEQEFC